MIDYQEFLNQHKLKGRAIPPNYSLEATSTLCSLIRPETEPKHWHKVFSSGTEEIYTEKIILLCSNIYSHFYSQAKDDVMDRFINPILEISNSNYTTIPNENPNFESKLMFEATHRDGKKAFSRKTSHVGCMRDLSDYFLSWCPNFYMHLVFYLYDNFHSDLRHKIYQTGYDSILRVEKSRSIFQKDLPLDDRFTRVPKLFLEK